MDDNMFFAVLQSVLPVGEAGTSWDNEIHAFLFPIDQKSTRSRCKVPSCQQPQPIPRRFLNAKNQCCKDAVLDRMLM